MTPRPATGLAALLLAAGESRRMGSPKALLRAGGNTFFGVAVGALARRNDLRPTLAIIHPSLLGRLQSPERLSGVLVNREPHLGQIHSLRLGLEWLDGQWKGDPPCGVMVLLVDNPGQLAQRVELLADGVRDNGPERVLAVGWKGSPGHPLWLPRSLWNGLRSWEGPEGLRGFLRAQGEVPGVLECPFASAVMDIDTVEDYEEFLRKEEGGQASP